MPSQERLLTELEIRSLVIRERYYRDSRQWEKLRSVYHPDASKTCIDISWITGDIDAFVSGSIKMASSGIGSAHTIQPVEITINNDKALSISYGNIILRVTFDGIEYDMESWGRFVHRAARVQLPPGPEWKLLSLEFIYDRDSIAPVQPLQVSSSVIDAAPDARKSYKYLEWVLTKRGYTIPNDLPGTDREESVTKLLGANEDWLNS